MADRYWVAGSPSNWNNTANWSDTSGGAGPVSVPGPADNVFFDGNGNNNCTIDAAVSVYDLTIDAAYTASFDNSVNNHNITTNGDYLNNCGTVDATKMGSGTWTAHGHFISNSRPLWNGCTLTMAGGNTHDWRVNASTTIDGTWNVPAGETIHFNGNASAPDLYCDINWDGHFYRTGGFAAQMKMQGANKTGTIGPNFSVAAGTFWNDYFYIYASTNYTLINNGDMRGFIGGVLLRGAGITTVEGTSSSWFPNLAASSYVSTYVAYKGMIRIDGDLNHAAAYNGANNSVHNPDFEIHNGSLLAYGTTYTKGTGTIKMFPAGAETINSIYAMEEIEIVGGGASTVTQAANLLTDAFKLTSGTYNNATFDINTVGDFETVGGSQWTPAGLNGSTITIGGNMLVVGESGNLTNWAAGSGWTLVVNGASATAVYVDVAYSAASGAGTPVNASASTDSFNNSGWTFGAFVTKYWIGGAIDDWDNATKWSLSSGGPNNTGIPTAGDRVILDGNSGNCRLLGPATCYSLSVHGPEDVTNGGFTGAFHFEQNWSMDIVEDFTIGDPTGAIAFTGNVHIGYSGTGYFTTSIGRNFYFVATTNTTFQAADSHVIMKATGSIVAKSIAQSGAYLGRVTINSGAVVTVSVPLDSGAWLFAADAVVINGTLSCATFLDTSGSYKFSTTVGSGGKITGAGKYATLRDVTNDGIIDIATFELHGTIGDTIPVSGGGTFGCATAIQFGSTRIAQSFTVQFSGTLTFTEAVTFYAGFGGFPATLTIDNATNNPNFEFQKAVSDVFSGGAPAITWTKGTGSIFLTTNSFSFGIRNTGALEPVFIDSTGNTITLSQNLSCQSITHLAGTLHPGSKNITTVGNFSISPNAQVNPAGLSGTPTWAVGGNIDWDGASGNLLNLQSGTTWYLNVSGTSNVQYTNVSNSDATGSAAPINSNYLNNINSGNNPNWDFFDDYRFWTGAGDGNWGSFGNWSSASGGASTATVPDITKDVFFDAVGNVACNINVNASMRSFNSPIETYTQTITVGAVTVTIAKDFEIGIDGNNMWNGYFTGAGSTWDIGGNLLFKSRADHFTSFTGNSLALTGSSKRIRADQNIYWGIPWDTVTIPNGASYEIDAATNVSFRRTSLTVAGSLTSPNGSGQNSTINIRSGCSLYLPATGVIADTGLTDGGLYLYFEAMGDTHTAFAQYASGSTLTLQRITCRSYGPGNSSVTLAAGTYDMPIRTSYYCDLILGAGTFNFNESIQIDAGATSNPAVLATVIDCATHSPTVNLKGDLIINRNDTGGVSTVEWKAGGTLTLNGTADQKLGTLDSGAYSAMTINNAGNTITGDAGIGIPAELRLTSLLVSAGTFDANDFDVIVSGAVEDSASGIILMGSGTWTVGGIFQVFRNTSNDSETSTLVMTSVTSAWLTFRKLNNLTVDTGAYINLNRWASSSTHEFTGTVLVRGRLYFNGGALYVDMKAGSALQLESGSTTDGGLTTWTFEEGSALTNNGGTFSLSGTIVVEDSSSSIDPGTYSCTAWRFRNTQATPKTLTLKSGTYGFNGALLFEKTGSGILTVDNSTNSPNIVVGSGNLTIGASTDVTYVKGNGTFEMPSAAGRNCDTNGQSLEDFTFDTSGTMTLLSAFKVESLTCVKGGGPGALNLAGFAVDIGQDGGSGNFTVPAGFGITTGNTDFNIAGNISINTTATWTKGAGTITLSGAGSGTQNLDVNGASIEGIVVNDSGATKQLVSTLTMASLTVTAGTFDANGYDVGVLGDIPTPTGPLFCGTGTWTVGGNVNAATGNFYPPTSMILTGTAKSWACTLVRQWTNVKIASGASINGSGSNVSINGLLDIEGTFNLSGSFYFQAASSDIKLRAGSTFTGIGSIWNSKTISEFDATATFSIANFYMHGNGNIVPGNYNCGLFRLLRIAGAGGDNTWIPQAGTYIFGGNFEQHTTNTIYYTTVNCSINNPNIEIKGNLDLSSETQLGNNEWIPGTGTLTFNGTGAQSINMVDGTNRELDTVVINKASGTLTPVSNIYSKGLTVTLGTFDADTFDIIASGNITLNGGTVLMGSGTWTCYGDWDSSAMAPTRETSTVTFLGATSHVFKTASTPSFYHVTIPAGETVSFSQSGQFTVWGNLTINGTISSTPGKILAMAGPGSFLCSIGASGVVGATFSSLDVLSDLTIAAGGTVDCTLAFRAVSGKLWTIADTASLKDIAITNGDLTFSNNTVTCDSLTLTNCTMNNNTNNPSFVIKKQFTPGSNWTKGTGTITVGGSGSGVYPINTPAEIEALTINDSGATRYISGGSTLKVAGFHAIAGTFDTDNQDVECSGDFIIESAVILDTGSGTITMNGTGDVDMDTNGKTIEDVIILKASGVTLLSDLSTHSLTVSTGDFDANDFNVTTTVGDVQMNSAGTLSMGEGTWTVAGNFTLSAGTTNEETSALVLTGAGKTLTGGRTYYDVEVSGTYTIASAISVHDLNVSGELAHGNLSYTISGDLTVDSGATWVVGTGAINLTGAGSGTQLIDTNEVPLEDLIVNDSGAIKQLSSNIRIDSLTLTLGTLDTNNMNIYILVGDLTVASAATYTRGIINSRVRFIGTGAQGLTVDNADIIDVIHVQKASGSFTFNTDANIEAFFGNQGDININGKTITTLDAFFMDSLADFAPVDVGGLNGCTINVGGNVTFVGSGGNILDMKATTEWFLNVTGSSIASYVDVSWSNALGGQPIFVNSSTSINSGNNKNWLFPVIVVGAGGRPIPQLLSIMRKEFGFPR